MYEYIKMDGQDWTTITWDKRGQKPKGVSDKTHLNNEKRKGNVIQTLKPESANKNKTFEVTNTKKIANEEETFKHKTIGMKIGNKIAQARAEKKLTREQLAQALFLPKKIIEEFENGKAIYNAVILNKLDKFFDKRFRE